jgi:hypothetical protein
MLRVSIKPDRVRSDRAMNPPAHPVQIVLRDQALERTRLTTFFRLILFIPHAVWWSIWGLGIVIVLPVQWVWALIVGGSTGLQEFYGRFMRYTVQLYGYMCLAADPWPTGLVGDMEYPVDVTVPERTRQNRWTIFFRGLLFLPPYLLSATLLGGGGLGGSYSTQNDAGSSDFSWNSTGQFGGVVMLVAIGAWFVIMARGRTTTGLRDLAVYGIGYAAQTWAYFTLLTGAYPNSTPALARPVPGPEHPVAVTVDDDLRRSRLTVFFRGLLFLPHLVWLVLWSLVMVVVAIINWFAALFTARVPDALHRFTTAYVRYRLHVYAFVLLAGNPFPGFTGRPGTYPVDLVAEPTQRQNRWKTLFRIVLALPAAALNSGLGGAALFAAIGAWFASLFTGRMPAGLRDLLAVTLRYDAQLSAYTLIATDRYPYSGPTLATGPIPVGDVPPPPAPAGWQPPVPPADWTTNPESV